MKILNNRVLTQSEIKAYLNESLIWSRKGFSGRSAGKESTWNAGDLSWDDAVEEGMATHSGFVAWRILMDR